MRSIAKVNGLGLFKMGLALMAALGGGFGCATAALSQQGAMVEMTDEIDKANCKNLGPVIGKGGGSFGGGWIADEDLIEYAMNDLRNKVAERGGTHVVTQGHEMGFTSGKDGGSTSTATITGIAYRCATPDTGTTAARQRPVVQGAPPAPQAAQPAAAPQAAPGASVSAPVPVPETAPAPQATQTATTPPSQ